MPQIQQTSGNAPAEKPYGLTQNSNTTTFQERMMKRFQAQEYVHVRNIDDEAVVWQYLPSHAEEFEYTPDPMKITRRAQPEMWKIEPGQSEALVGSNAYLMLDNLYKRMAAKKVLNNPVMDNAADRANGVARNFNYSDPEAQERFLDRALLGKAQMTFAADIPQVDPAEHHTEKAKTGVSTK